MDLPRKLAKLFFVACASLCAPATAQPEAPTAPPGSPRPPMGNIPRVPGFHDPSTPVKQGDTWYIFSTGNGISTRSSKDLKTWTAGERVFRDLPAWHKDVAADQKGHLWAPDAIHLGNRYLLYYSVSAWGKNTSAIGLVTSPTLDPKSPDYQWKDEGIVIQSRSKDPYNAIDPQLYADTDGSLWMVFGSFWKGIYLVRLDPKTGLRHAEDREVRQLAWNETIEAAALLKHGGYYYLFVNWGLCCRGVNSTYEVRVGRSRKITGPYLDQKGDDLATGGGTLFLKSEGDRIGPGHPAFVTENGSTRMFYHYYDRRRNGAHSLGELTLGWTDGGWPRP